MIYRINFIKKNFLILLITSLLLSASFARDVFAQYIIAPKFLCDMGEQFYLQGKYRLALEQFKVALLLDPNSATAKEGIKKIYHLLSPESTKRKEVISSQLSKLLAETPEPEVTKEVAKKERKATDIKLQREETIDRTFRELSLKSKAMPSKMPPEPVIVPKIFLDESTKADQSRMKLEIELERTIDILGRQITRWLIISPNIVDIVRKNSSEIGIRGKSIGRTYVHLWDNSGRWTFDIVCLPTKPIGPTLDEELRLAEERARSFKLEYRLDWNLLESGRRLDELERESYGYTHSLNLAGLTPYGRFDATASVRKVNTSTDLTFINLELTEGKFGPFEDFTLKGFDFSPDFSNLIFSAATLRGALLSSPAFNNKIDYSLFWGREGGGRYGGLSPGLAKIKDSFLAGFDFDYTPSKNTNYGFSVLRGWGRAREDYLNEYNYDFQVSHFFENLGLDYEAAYDSENFGHLGGFDYHRPRLRLTGELRNIDKDFVSANGFGWRRGELGGLLTLKAKPKDDIEVSSRLDVFQDRLYPAEDNDQRFNINFDIDTYFRLDPLTNLRLDYILYNELGRVSQFRSQSQGASLSKTWDWIRRFNTFLTYRHSESKHYSSPGLDYINDQLSSGLRFNLIGELYYYINKEINWLKERGSGSTTKPNALETGLDWYGKIFDTPLSLDLRVTYRDEEDATSALSFFSGEDYLETYGEITYSPKPDMELYVSSRLRNIWADNPNVNQRMEFDIYAGMRYLWDTGFRWEPVGSICGYVFDDLNFDGIRQENESGVKNIKLWLGKKNFKLTDEDGFYRFKKIKARKAYVTIDTAGLPKGFLLTTPIRQDAEITQSKEISLNFGIASHTEIYGIVFEDIDRDGKYGRADIGIKDAVLVLEDGTEHTTDARGRYFFRRVSTGEHTITLKLESLPLSFLPQVPLTKKITLFEGVSYVYNIPVTNSAK